MVWFVLEDNPNRTAAFANAAKLCRLPVETRIWRIAAQMIQELPELLPSATLLSLDHDLYKQDKSDPDPGCGRDVANYLAKQKPLCPIIIHSTNTDAAWGMHNELTAAGWKVEIIHHLDEADWIETRWLALAQKLARKEANPVAGAQAPKRAARSDVSRRAVNSQQVMKLYITPGSPYARMARMVVLEKGLESRVEIIAAKTRIADSPYYEINPSGRVPYLVREDGVGMEESALICAYLDRLDGKPAFELPADGLSWEARRLEALARSLMDGLAVWGREIARPGNERSPGVIEHEKERARRMVDLWEHEIEHRHMSSALNMIQITLACALGLDARNPGFLWRPGHPKLSKWFDRIAARPSFTATAPPSA